MNAGVYTAVASFPGSTDYYPASASTSFTIGQATPSVLVSDSGGIDNGTAYPAAAAVAGLNGVLGSSLEGVSPTVSYYSGTVAAGAPGGRPTQAGTYTALATYPGSTDYSGTSARPRLRSAM